MKSEHLYFDLYQQNLKKFQQVKGDEWRGCCPWHDDNNPSLTINVRKGMYWCPVCKVKGNAVKFAKHFSIDPKPFYSDEYKRTNGKQTGNSVDKRRVTNGQPSKTEGKQEGIPPLEDLTNQAIEYYKNGVDKNTNKTMTMLEIGRDKDGRTAYPYHNNKGQVVGIWHHKHPDKKKHKEKFGLGFWEGDGSLKWYLAELLDDYDKNQPLFICEGHKDAVHLLHKGYNVICSSSPSAVPKSLPVFKEFKEIILIYDNDDAGRLYSENCATKLYQSMEIRCWIVQWNPDLPSKFDVSDDTHWIEVPNAINNAVQYEFELPNKIGAFTIMTGKQASNTEPIPLEWIIENIMPKRFNGCLAGTTGSKKSYWAMQLGMSLANGEKSFCGNKIMGRDKNERSRKVLYVDTEIGQEETHRRFRRIQKHMNWTDQGDDHFRMMVKDGTSIDIWDYVHDMMGYWKSDVIIFDSLYNTTTVGDFSHPSQMSSVTNSLEQFKEYGSTVLTIAHFNKGQGDMGLDINRMSGSSVLQNWIEWQMLMVKTNISNFNLWKVAKTRGTATGEDIIGLEWDDFWFTTKGVVVDWKPFLIDEHKKYKWQNVLDDLPEQFCSQDWLSVFKSKHPNYSERTGREWLSQCKRTPILNYLGHDKYEKNLKVIDEWNIDDEETER